MFSMISLKEEITVISTFFKIELKIIFRKKLYLVVSIFLPVVFYLLFTSILTCQKKQNLSFIKSICIV